MTREEKYPNLTTTISNNSEEDPTTEDRRMEAKVIFDQGRDHPRFQVPTIHELPPPPSPNQVPVIEVRKVIILGMKV